MTRLLIDSLVSTDALRAAFSDDAVIGAMLEFESALARAEARLGLIPPEAAEAIVAASRPDGMEAAGIARGARGSATIAIPFVDRLRARVRASHPPAATFVHWGATSQDVCDTALVLCLERAKPLLAADETRLSGALKRLADQHANTIMLARTLLQPAPPTTFGLKAAGWLAAVSRTWRRVSDAFDETGVVQFGGASGTLAALGDDGPRVAAELARILGLRDPGAPWHAHRDRLATLVAACGVHAGTLAKIARDVSLLMQEEVAEAAEPGGTSSAMPHKRNPVGCAAALAAAARLPGLVSTFLSALPQEHERGLGAWGVEASTIAAAVESTGAAGVAIADVCESLRVDAERMRANLDATRGTIFAERAMMLLGPIVGRDRAARIIAEAVAASRQDPGGFATALASHADVRNALDRDTLAGLGVPEAYLGASEAFRRRLLESIDGA